MKMKMKMKMKCLFGDVNHQFMACPQLDIFADLAWLFSFRSVRNGLQFCVGGNPITGMAFETT